MAKSKKLMRWLESAPVPLFTLYAIFASFSTYFCMYAFRKPFSAAQYEDMNFFTGASLKSAFVISQLIGYVLAKIIGTKVCSEISRERRPLGLVLMILVAQVGLFLFAVLPGDFKVVALFINGLSLGMIWGLVVWFLEGRTTSEMLLAGLSCSFILASGVVKDMGNWLMSVHEIDQFWMPFAMGVLFLPPFILSVYFLAQIPVPTQEDILARSERTTMNSEDRWRFMRQLMPGIIMLVVSFFFLTAYRDYRDNFGTEIYAGITENEGILFIVPPEELQGDWEKSILSEDWWKRAYQRNDIELSGSVVVNSEEEGKEWQIKVGSKTHIVVKKDEKLVVYKKGFPLGAIFTRTELWIMFSVIVAMALLNLIKDNLRGLLAAFGLMMLGLIMMGAGTAAYDAGLIGGVRWMFFCGLGVYLAYVPYGSVLFDRIIASTRVVGTAVFAIYIADTCGYGGVITILLLKDSLGASVEPLDFFRYFNYATCVLGTVLMLASAIYFIRKAKRAPTEVEPPDPVDAE
jgi:hypothetical protein